MKAIRCGVFHEVGNNKDIKVSGFKIVQKEYEEWPIMSEVLCHNTHWRYRMQYFIRCHEMQRKFCVRFPIFKLYLRNKK